MGLSVSRQWSEYLESGVLEAGKTAELFDWLKSGYVEDLEFVPYSEQINHCINPIDLFFKIEDAIADAMPQLGIKTCQQDVVANLAAEALIRNLGLAPKQYDEDGNLVVNGYGEHVSDFFLREDSMRVDLPKEIEKDAVVKMFKVAIDSTYGAYAYTGKNERKWGKTQGEIDEEKASDSKQAKFADRPKHPLMYEKSNPMRAANLLIKTDNYYRAGHATYYGYGGLKEKSHVEVRNDPTTTVNNTTKTMGGNMMNSEEQQKQGLAYMSAAYLAQIENREKNWHFRKGAVTKNGDMVKDIQHDEWETTSEKEYRLHLEHEKEKQKLARMTEKEKEAYRKEKEERLEKERLEAEDRERRRQHTPEWKLTRDRRVAAAKRRGIGYKVDIGTFVLNRVIVSRIHPAALKDILAHLIGHKYRPYECMKLIEQFDKKGAFEQLDESGCKTVLLRAAYRGEPAMIRLLAGKKHFQSLKDLDAMMARIPYLADFRRRWGGALSEWKERCME